MAYLESAQLENFNWSEVKKLRWYLFEMNKKKKAKKRHLLKHLHISNGPDL